MLKLIRTFIDKLIFIVCSILLIIMVVDVSWQVFARYVLNNPPSFTDEAARFLMIYLGLLGSALLFGKCGHLAITVVTDRLSLKYKKLVTYFSYFLITCFTCFSMIYGGYNLVLRTIRQPSPSMHIPMGVIYSILPIAGVLILIYVALNLLDMAKDNNVKAEEN